MTSAYAPEISGLAALTHSDDGRYVDPRSDAEWHEWVAASKTRNWCLDDPLLDWLDEFGAGHGLVPDQQRAGYDPRTDFQAFVLHRAAAFEAAVAGLIEQRLPVVRIGASSEDSRELERAVATFEAMCAGAPVIYQGVLRDPQSQTYGVADLLVRGDALRQLFPSDISAEQAALGAPALGGRWHYRVVDIKFRTLALNGGGGLAAENLPQMVQTWLYNEALGRIQGLAPDASFLLGRNWRHGTNHEGKSCFERLGRIDRSRIIGEHGPLADVAAEAVSWIRRMRTFGAGWQVLPEPTVPELFPNARNTENGNWVHAKGEIATAIAELTLLPGVTPARRRAALEVGLRRWDGLIDTNLLELPDGQQRRTEAVLEVNRPSPATGGEVVMPAKVNLVGWRIPAKCEFYVDFESVSNLNDDLARLPYAGGQPLIYQIGCGMLENNEWNFRQFTVNALTEAEELRVLEDWLQHMQAEMNKRGAAIHETRIIHWSPAETSLMTSAYNSAARRHSDRSWPTLPWFDFLGRVVREEPIVVKGAFSFSLKSIAKAMHNAGLIETVWEDGPTDGLGAMVGAWSCAEESARTGVPMSELPLMREISHYNEVDCRAMAEVVGWLRVNR